MGRKKGSKTKPISVRDDILVLDKPIYMAKWRTKLVPVILRSEEGGTYTVCSVKDTAKKCWVVPQHFHLAKDEQRKVHGPSRPKTPDAATTSSKKATDQNEAGTSHSQKDAVGLTKSKESDSDFEKPHKKRKVHWPSRPKTPDAATTSSKKASDQNEAGTSHSQEDTVGLTNSKESDSDSDFEKPHKKRKVHRPSRPKTPDAATTSSKKATDQNEAGTSHSQEDAVGLTKSKESDSDFEKPHKKRKVHRPSRPKTPDAATTSSKKATDQNEAGTSHSQEDAVGLTKSKESDSDFEKPHKKRKVHGPSRPKTPDADTTSSKKATDLNEAGTSHSQEDAVGLTNSNEAAVLLMDLFRRKAISAPYKNKPKNEMGKFGNKNPVLLSWRRYCVHKFSLQRSTFFVVCCNNVYQKASGLITHLHRKH